MTPDDVREATAEAAQAATAVTDHLERLIGRLSTLLPVVPEALRDWGDDPRERLHALLRMYEQTYDLTARKLVRGLLFLSGETIAGLSAQNQFRRVEALGGIDSADRWIALGVTRNILVHHYPVDPVAQAQRANRAWADLPDLIAATRRIVSHLRQEGLIR